MHDNTKLRCRLNKQYGLRANNPWCTWFSWFFLKHTQSGLSIITKKQSEIRNWPLLKVPRQTKDERNQATVMYRTGSSNCAIAQRCASHHSTSTRLISRYQHTGSVLDHLRPEQPRATTAQQDAYIRVSYSRDRFLTPTKAVRRTIGTHGWGLFYIGNNLFLSNSEISNQKLHVL